MQKALILVVLLVILLPAGLVRADIAFERAAASLEARTDSGDVTLDGR